MLTKWSKDFAIPQVWHIRTGIVEEARFGESTVYIVSRNIRKPLFGTQIEGKSEYSEHKHIGDTTKHNTNKIVYSSGNRTNRIFFRVMVFMMRSTWLQEVQFYCVPTIWWRTLGRSSLCSQFMISCMYPCWCVLLVEFLHPTLWGDYKGVISIPVDVGILKNPSSFAVFCLNTVCSTISLCDCHHTNLGYWSAIYRGIECSNHIDFNNLLIRPVSPVLGVMMEGV